MNRRKDDKRNSLHQTSPAFLSSQSSLRTAPSPNLGEGRGEVKKVAFTLAEVLVTLGIIGVVAALTMPSLIAKHQEKVTVTKVKKAYNVLSNALLMAKSEYGEINEWEFTDDQSTNSKMVGEKIVPFLSITKNCGISESAECGLGNPDGSFYRLNGVISTTDSFNLDMFYKFMISDGTTIAIRGFQNTEYFDVTVDINGNNKPNTLGKDIFHFVSSDNKFLPQGINQDPSNTSAFPYCNPKRDGWSCAAWVVFKENMDYLKCADELQWNGNSKCK